MTSPILNEGMIAENFNCELKAENAERVTTGAFLVAVDAYDRKVTRHHFIAALGATTALYDALARLSVINNIRDFLDKTGNFTLADLELAGQSAQKLVELHTGECVKIIRLLQQCPMNEDPIH